MDKNTFQDMSYAGHHQECLEACQELLQSEPDNPFAWKLGGKSLLALRQFEKAQHYLIKSHQLDDKDPETIKDIGNTFLNLGNKNQALEWYQKAIDINDNYAPAISNLANLKRQSGNTQEAIDLFKRAIQADPKLIQAYVGAAASYLRLGHLNQAKLIAEQGSENNKNTPGINETLGIIFQSKSNPEIAIRYYEKELEINPQAYNSLYNIGKLYLQQGYSAKAVNSLAKASAIAPSEECSLLLAQSYQNSGQFLQAITEYEKINLIKSKNKLIPFNLGVCLLNTSKNAAAIDVFRIAIQLDKRFFPAWGNLGTALINEGRHLEAISATNKALEIEPDSHTANINLGIIYKELGQLDQALDITLKAIKLKPDNTKSLYLLGTIKLAFGEISYAKRLFRNVIKSNPHEYNAYYELSRALSTEQEAKELMECIQLVKISHLMPREKSSIQFAMSNCLHKIKNYNQAAKYLRSANKNKLAALPSNAVNIQQMITSYLTPQKSTARLPTNTDCGKNRIFIVGMPRSGSTLLETILCMNPEIEGIGESLSLRKAIRSFQNQTPSHHNKQTLDDIYSHLETINIAQTRYTLDKQLYNFIYTEWIATYMPAAKIIHCIRNPMDNLLSMYRSNLSAGNNYTSDLEDAAKVLITHEQVMQIYKERHPNKIFTFDYDKFVHGAEVNLAKLLEWLELEFDQKYLRPEKSTKSINNSSVIQARRPINNKSVHGWKNYENLLKPAQYILHNSGHIKN